MGGAIFNHNGTVSIINSTLALNIAQGGIGTATGDHDGYGANGGSGIGGAIFNLNGTIAITNSTVASNGITGGLGTVIDGHLPPPAVSGLPGAAAGGALYSMVYDSAMSRTGAVTVVNSILAGSVGGSDVVNIFPTTTSAGTNLGSVRLVASEPNIFQSFTNGGGVFISNGVVAVNPLLGPLANNGGPTPTMLPLPGSPAIDAGDTKLAPATDQRGMPRVSGAAVDLGAVEVTGPAFFTGFSFPAPGQFQLQFRGVAGAGYSVLVTTNLNLPLSGWMVLGAATEVSNGVFRFTDSQGVNAGTRYYRVRQM